MDELHRLSSVPSARHRRNVVIVVGVVDAVLESADDVADHRRVDEKIGGRQKRRNDAVLEHRVAVKSSQRVPK